MSLRRRLLRCALVLAGLANMPAFAGQATPPVEIRYGAHEHFGRLVFDMPGGARLAADHHDNQIVVKLGAASHVPAGALPPNVRAVREQGGAVTIEVAAGSVIRRMIVNDHLVIDVLDPPSAPGKAAKPVAEPATRPPPPPPPPPPSPAPVVASAAPAAPALAAEPPAAAPQAAELPSAPPPPPSVSPAPETLTASAQPAPQSGPGHQLTLPFGPGVGAAAFRRGGEAVLVFDERKPVDLQALRDDPVFGQAKVQLLPSATVLRVPLPAPAELRLEHHDTSWVITAIGGDATPPPLLPIISQQEAGIVALPAAQPGLVISVPDPVTGGILAVGTQRRPGQGVAAGRETPDFRLWPSWQGVVVEPLSDVVALRAAASGFQITAQGGDAALVATQQDAGFAAATAASRMSRVFDLPPESTGRLIRRMQGAVVAASETPPQSRAGARAAVAQSMLALGLGAEAQAVLGLAAIGDARALDDPTTKGLTAVAALLAGRTEAAAGLDDPRLDGSDEIAFWRGVRLAMMHEGTPAAAQIFASTLPLLLSYPAELQHRLLPLVAETMALGGQDAAATTLLGQYKDDPSLDLARAFARQARGGDPAEALAQFDRLAQSPDRLLRARATRSGVELRLASGRCTPAQAAEALGKMLYAWRGDDREVDLRLRVAELLAQSSQWRPALQLLRETEATWPDRHDPIHARLQATLAQSLTETAQAALKPFDLVALAEENADLMPDGEAGQALAQRVSEQLLALDLPDQASGLLEKMVATAPPGLARATFGAKLAALRLQQAQPAAAIDALTATVNASLPAALLEERTLIFARAVAREGDFASASRALHELDTPSGEAALADLAEEARQWPDAVTALLHVVGASVPTSGALDETQARLILRVASAASEAGNDMLLARLRVDDAARMPPGKTADLFNLLTSQPVAAITDLPRASREMALVRAIPGALPPLASK